MELIKWVHLITNGGKIQNLIDMYRTSYLSSVIVFKQKTKIKLCQNTQFFLMCTRFDLSFKQGVLKMGIHALMIVISVIGTNVHEVCRSLCTCIRYVYTLPISTRIYENG